MDFLPEVVGHEDLRAELHRLHLRDRLPGGLLFAGGAGRGKRTLARAFARAVLVGDAEGRVDPHSPGARKVDSDNHPDLEMVEAEPGRRLVGIDQIRRLKDAFSLKPVEARRRFGVVVDAHQLTEEASNALLKLLEEPPPSSHLILTARSRESIMTTLLSRCRLFRVGPVPTATIAAWLEAAGVAADRAGIAAALAEGQPGAARELAAGGEEALLAPAILLLFPEEGGHVAGDLVVAAARQGTTRLEEVRSVLRPILETVVRLLRAALRARLGAGQHSPLLEGLPEEHSDRPLPAGSGAPRAPAPPRPAAPPRDLDANVSPELVLGNLALGVAAGG